MDILKNLEEIKIEKPADVIIKQIKNLISSGQLNPGDRLPPERQLSEKFGVGRSHVRDALRKLEFYGILKTLPQSGTMVAGIGVAALEGLINDVLELNDHDFYSFVETRVLLEVHSAQLAAERATTDDIIKIKNALDAFQKKVSAGKQGVEEDLLFHLKIAEASKNSVLNSLLLIIVPDMIKLAKNLDICGEGRFKKAYDEHLEIFECINSHDVEGAGEAMKNHLLDILSFSLNKKNDSKFSD
ncbi:FadR/GntR family transcriptional regulator [Chondrinema litorale]|uniref:FadR/GntR family transcriptional regulator n=1 Tax=Chondrinema litorale TaxID=2994555 RepID=UPI002543E1FA|nr:FadR/GntR family transcriptional regulator [Chondrinema litorale]UZR98964.1 FadR/GntR family transcriptional regulator [Chondrinema litorale]